MARFRVFFALGTRPAGRPPPVEAIEVGEVVAPAGVRAAHGSFSAGEVTDRPYSAAGVRRSTLGGIPEVTIARTRSGASVAAR